MLLNITERQRLVLLATRKDKEAFATLYEEIYVDLYRYAYYTLQNTHDAEDAVSEAVADAFHGIKRLRNPDAFKSWMFAILSAKCKRRLKEYTRKAVPLHEDMMEAQGIAACFSEGEIPRAEDRQDIRAAMLQLSDRERLILNLSVVAGFTSAEIGKMLHMNHNTVRSVQSRALGKLKEYLKE